MPEPYSAIRAEVLARSSSILQGKSYHERHILRAMPHFMVSLCPGHSIPNFGSWSYTASGIMAIFLHSQARFKSWDLPLNSVVSINAPYGQNHLELQLNSWANVLLRLPVASQAFPETFCLSLLFMAGLECLHFASCSWISLGSGCPDTRLTIGHYCIHRSEYAASHVSNEWILCPAYCIACCPDTIYLTSSRPCFCLHCFIDSEKTPWTHEMLLPI